MATEEGQQTKARNHHKTSVAAHYDHHYRVLFPGPRLHQGREQDAVQQLSLSTSSRRDGAAATARWVRPMTLAI
jgi:hypothetical protein